jgi:hypothetical protein
VKNKVLLSEECFVSVETGLVKKLSIVFYIAFSRFDVMLSFNSAPPYPDISSLQDSKLQMTDVKMQLLTANWKDVNDFDFPARYIVI